MNTSNAPKLSLYANLLNPKSDETTGTTISSGPVLYKQASHDGNGESDKRSETATQFRFQPGSVKRPQQATQKPKKKPVISHAIASFPGVPASAAAASASASDVGNSLLAPSADLAVDAQRPTYSLADWMDDGDDVNEFLDQKRPRKKKKKGKNAVDDAPREVNWDDFYNLREWTNLEQWKTSVARIRKHNEWKDYLKSHARGSKDRRSSYSSDGSSPPRRPMPSAFAPPTSMIFAPPASFDTGGSEARDDEMMDPVDPSQSSEQPTGESTGEDAYLRRTQIQQISMTTSPPPPPPPPPPAGLETSAPPPPPLSVPSNPHTTISRPPVRYKLPEVPFPQPVNPDQVLEDNSDEMDIDLPPEPETLNDEVLPTDQGPSLRPGQKDFARRYMAKLGYQKGQGLGATGSGIVSALSVQKQKQKKRSDAEGGGVINGKAAMGRIIGGRRNPGEDGEGLYGKMSRVVRVLGLLDGRNVEAELGVDGGFVQEIGMECGEKYGTVERIYVARAISTSNPPVFIKFTSELSALRAVNALNDQPSVAGNRISARFWDVDWFEDGVFDVPSSEEKKNMNSRVPDAMKTDDGRFGRGDETGWN